MPMMIDSDQIIQAMLAAEAELNRLAWDQDPFLAILSDPGADHFEFTELPVKVEGAPGAYVTFVAREFEQHPHLVKALLQDKPGAYAILLVCEAWQGDKDSKIRRNKPLADIPGSVEIRMINLVDRYGRAFQLQRERGKQPECFMGGTDIALTGRVYIGLHSIMTSIARQLPDNEQYLTSLKANDPAQWL